MTIEMSDPKMADRTGLQGENVDTNAIVASEDIKVDTVQPPSGKMGIGNWIVLIVLMLLLAGTVAVAFVGWTLEDAADVPASGYIALAIGVVLSLAVGFGLMALVFFSSRKGYDGAPVFLPPETRDHYES